jgi:hypothetical protein
MNTFKIATSSFREIFYLQDIVPSAAVLRRKIQDHQEKNVSNGHIACLDRKRLSENIVRISKCRVEKL